MSRSLTRLQALVLGAVVLLGLGLTAVGVFAVGNRQWLWNQSFHLIVGFQQVRGVEVGTPVRIQGVVAGEVVAVEPPTSRGGEVRVRLRLDAKFRSLVGADASAQIVSEGMLGGKAIEIDPGSAGAEPVADNATIASRPTVELTDTVKQVSSMLPALEGRVGEVANNMNAMLKKGTETLEAFHGVAEGAKRLPGFRNYVEDPNELVFRANSEPNRQYFATADLFESDRAVLTAQGRERLKGIIPWVLGLTQHDGAEVVILAYADPKTVNGSLAKTLTQQQSETVGNYLQTNNAIHKRYGLMARKPVMRGMGTGTSPVAEKGPLPPARVEVLVFVPQK